MESLKLDESYLLVSAIDFGETYSGYAFSFKESPNDIKMHKNWGSSIASSKTPTVVLTNPDGSFNSFGYEAEDEYLQHDPEEGYQIYRSFQMVLYKKDLSMDCMVESASLHARRAIDIFAMSLKFLCEHLIADLNHHINLHMQSNDIRWVVTVPAICQDKAIHFMRQAALEAKMIPEFDSASLLIALEPGAALCYCRSISLKDFIGGDSEPGGAKFRSGDKVMIIDVGGESVFITAHEILIKGDVRDIVPPSAGPWGGCIVNTEFLAALAIILGKDFLNHMKATSPQDWIFFLRIIDITKRNVKLDGKKKVVFQLPFSFGEQFLKLKGKNIEDAIKECGDKDVSFESGYLVMCPNKVKSFFEETCTQTVNHVKRLFEKRPALEDVNYIVLVGEYGNSPVIQDACTEAFGNKRKVLVPPHAETAIIQGAVLFGHQPHVTYQADLALDEQIQVASKNISGLKVTNSSSDEEETNGKNIQQELSQEQPGYMKREGEKRQQAHQLKKMEEDKQTKCFTGKVQDQSEKIKIQTREKINCKMDSIIYILEKTTMDIEKIKECIKHENAVREAVDSQIDELTKYVQDEHAATLNETLHNEYVYYRIFNVIARTIGSSPHQWKTLAEILLKCFPEPNLQETLQSVDLRHISDTDKAFEILMTWKVFTADHTTVTDLMKALEPLKLGIGSEIAEIVTTQERKINPEATDKLSDKGLKKVAKGIGYERIDLGFRLGFKETSLKHFMSYHPNSLHQRTTAMLINWRNSFEAPAHEKLKILEQAMSECNIQDDESDTADNANRDKHESGDVHETHRDQSRDEEETYDTESSWDEDTDTDENSCADGDTGDHGVEINDTDTIQQCYENMKQIIARSSLPWCTCVYKSGAKIKIGV